MAATTKDHEGKPVKAPSAPLWEEREAEAGSKKSAPETGARRVAKDCGSHKATQDAVEIAALCVEHGLLSDEMESTLGLAKGSSQASSWWPLLAVNLTAGLALGLLRRKITGSAPALAAAGAALCFSVSGGCGLLCLGRTLLLREARRACTALQHLFEQAEAAVQLLRGLEIEAEDPGGLTSLGFKAQN
eukprot:s2142_g2.t1